MYIYLYTFIRIKILKERQLHQERMETMEVTLKDVKYLTTLGLGSHRRRHAVYKSTKGFFQDVEGGFIHTYIYVIYIRIYIYIYILHFFVCNNLSSIQLYEGMLPVRTRCVYMYSNPFCILIYNYTYLYAYKYTYPRLCN
jgi:hypothetical protein